MFKVHKEMRWLSCSPPVVFSQHETEYALHIPQYGLREGGRLSIPSQQALHDRPMKNESFLTAFLLPWLLEQSLSKPFAEKHPGFVLEKTSQGGPKHPVKKLVDVYT